MLKSKKFASKSYFNVNYISYVLIYLVYSSIFVFLNNYFPILFFEVLNINRIILACMQFLAYSVLLLRPAFAALTDKYRIKGFQRKYYIILSGYFFALIYILIGFSFTNIICFGFFLFFMFLSATMLDVSTKSLIIDISQTKETKKQAFFFIAFGQSLGKTIPFFLYLILINDIYSPYSWNLLFISSYILLIPLMSIIPFISEKKQEESQFIENFDPSNSNDLAYKPNFKKLLVLLCIFVFFAFSDIIFAYPFFPFVLAKFGTIKFKIFNFYLTFYFLISILSSAIGTFIIKKTEPKKMILILIPIIGIIYILYTIVDFTLFTLLYFIGSSLATITNLNISVYIMKFKKGNKSVYFHLIASFKNLSFFIFLPIGTILSIYISTEYIIIIGAILLNLCIIPLIFIKF